MAKSQKRAKAEGTQWYPKGFDITLMQVIEEYGLTEVECTNLGRATNGMAHATFGYEVFYRRNQIEGFIAEMRTTGVEVEAPYIIVDESTDGEQA